MKLLLPSITVLSTMALIVSAQTWNIRFYLNSDCTPANTPIQQRSGTSNMNCRQLAIVNGPSNSFRFNGDNAFGASVCRTTDCNDCDDAQCDSAGECVPGVPGEPYRSFLVFRDENCPGRRLLE
jgi:hypothetical protein